MYFWSSCRVCLANVEGHPNAVQLATQLDDESEETDIGSFIEGFAGFTISKASKLAQQICDDCYLELLVALRLRKKCRDSDKLLGDFLLQQNELIKSENFDYLHENELPVEEFDDHFDNDVQDEDVYSLVDAKDPILEAKVETEEKIVAVAEEEDEEENDEKPRTKAKKSPRAKDIQMCDLCGNIFSKRCLLVMHMKRHNNERTFECEICQKRFLSHSELSRHMRTHTGVKPFKCKYCDRRFADRSTNIKHERTHTNERPFVCETCGKAFMYSNVLKNHILTHTGEKKFECIPCEKVFSRQHQLKQHFGTHIHQKTAAKVDKFYFQV